MHDDVRAILIGFAFVVLFLVGIGGLLLASQSSNPNWIADYLAPTIVLIAAVSIMYSVRRRSTADPRRGFDILPPKPKP